MADKPFLIEIKSVAQLEAAKQAEQSLKRALDAAKAAGQPTAELERNLKAVNAALESNSAKAVKAADSTRKAASDFSALAKGASPLSEAMRDLGQRVPLVGRAMDFLTNPIGAVIAAFTGLLALLRSGITEFSKQEVATVKLHAAMAQWGQLTKENAENYNKLATELQRTTGVADDDWLKVIKTLIQFGSKPEAIGMDVEAVKNLAGLLGGDLNQAAMLWGKALQGQFELFGRYGIVIDQTASQMEKMSKLQAELAVRGGGQLEVMLTTNAGKWVALKNAVGDVMEEAGGAADKFFNLKLNLDQLTVAAQEFPTVLRESHEWLQRHIPLAASMVDALVGESDAWTKLDNKRKAALTTAAQLEEAEKSQKKALEDVTAAAKDAADAFTRLMEAQKDFQQFQDELSDIDMAIALERLKAQNLPEVVRLQAEKGIRAQFAREKSERKEQGFRDTAGNLEWQAQSVESEAIRAETEAAMKRKRAREVAAYEAQQAKADAMQRQFDKEVADMAEMQSGLSGATAGDVAAAEAKLAGDVERIARERERAMKMRSGLAFGGLGADGKLRPNVPVETSGEAAMAANAAEALAKEKRKTATDTRKAFSPQIEAAAREAEQEARLRAKREELDAAATANEVRAAEEKRRLDDLERAKKGLPTSIQERFPNVRPGGEAGLRNLEAEAARRAAEAALGTRPVTAPRGKTGVQEPPVDAVPYSPERFQAPNVSAAGHAFEELSALVVSLANNMQRTAATTAAKVEGAVAAVGVINQRLEHMKTQV